MAVSCDQLIARHATAWEEATRHQFLEVLKLEWVFWQMAFASPGT